MYRFCEQIVCKSGLKLSVQASSGHYCEPRDDIGPYVAVEVGFPSRMVPEFMEYCEDPDKPTKTVYGWVPTLTVRSVIADNGGAISGTLPPSPDFEGLGVPIQK